MNRRLVLICLIFLFGSCFDDDYKVPEYYFGIAAAKINSDSWSSQPYAQRNSNGTINLHMDVLSNTGAINQSITIFNLPLEVGDHKLEFNSISARYEVFYNLGRQTCHTYEILDNISKVEIQSVDISTNQFKGKFEINFQKNFTDGNCSLSSPLEVSFSSGSFNTKVTR